MKTRPGKAELLSPLVERVAEGSGKATHRGKTEL